VNSATIQLTAAALFYFAGILIKIRGKCLQSLVFSNFLSLVRRPARCPACRWRPFAAMAWKATEKAPFLP